MPIQASSGNGKLEVALVLFARLPVPGKAKTRLAAGIGPEAAAGFYRVCAEHAFREALRCPDVRPEVHCSTAEEAPAVAAWLESCGCAMPVRPQLADPDLGVRMHASLRTAAGLATGPAGAACGGGGLDGGSRGGGSSAAPGAAAAPRRPRAVMVAGTDVPGLRSETLSAAAAALLAAAGGDGGGGDDVGCCCGGAGDVDAVLGPAADGGYYLLGLTAAALASPAAAALFEGIPWSTPGVLAATRAAAAAAGLRLAPGGALPVMRDIDTLQDLAEWAAEAVAGAGARAGASAVQAGAHASPDERAPALAASGGGSGEVRASEERPEGADGGAASPPHPLLPLAMTLLKSVARGVASGRR